MTIERDPVLGKALERALPRTSPPYGAKSRVRRALERRTRGPEKSWRWIAVACFTVALSAVVLEKTLGPRTPVADHGSVLSLDGVRVVLRSKADVTVDSDGPSGTVLRLASGTVFLKVRKGHPTAVVAGKVRVDVIGTLFGVARAATEAVDVSVVEGVVRVKDDRGERTLRAGDRLPPNGDALYPTPPEFAALEQPAPTGSSSPVPPTPTGIGGDAVRSDGTAAFSPPARVASEGTSTADLAPKKSRNDSGAAQGAAPRGDFGDYLRARELERHEDIEEALDAYARIVKKGGADAEDALFAIIRLAAQRRQPNEALTRAAEYRSRYGGGRYARDVDVMVLNAHLTLGDGAAAAKDSDQFLSKFPSDPRAWRFHLARAERALEAHDCAAVKAELETVPDGELKRKLSAACN